MYAKRHRSHPHVQLKNPAGWLTPGNIVIRPDQLEQNLCHGNLQLNCHPRCGNAFLAHGHGQVNISSHSAERKAHSVIKSPDYRVWEIIRSNELKAHGAI